MAFLVYAPISSDSCVSAKELSQDPTVEHSAIDALRRGTKLNYLHRIVRAFLIEEVKIVKKIMNPGQ